MDIEYSERPSLQCCGGTKQQPQQQLQLQPQPQLQPQQQQQNCQSAQPQPQEQPSSLMSEMTTDSTRSEKCTKKCHGRCQCHSRHSHHSRFLQFHMNNNNNNKTKISSRSSSRRWCNLLSLFVLILFMDPKGPIISRMGCLAALPCTNDMDCNTKLHRDSSYCINGFCSNPFAQEGCLKTLRPEQFASLPPRACNSDDIFHQQQQQQQQQQGTTLLDDNGDDSSPSFVSLPCVDYNIDLRYPEIRIHNGNWESSIFIAWILQILLMEVLHVPTTVGLTTSSTAASGFYSIQNTLEYSKKAYPFEALRDANGPCHLIHSNNGNGNGNADEEAECAHVLPEVWNGQLNEWTAALNEGYIAPLEGNGQVGKGSWYVPQFTAARDEGLVSFYGLRGEEKRQKLATDFLKPTSWKDYCEFVSNDNCTTPDETAQLYPPNDASSTRYYAPPEYMGYFRLTEENNCTIHPDTCMGHIVGPSCTWSTNIDAQLYWNDIHLKPDGPNEPNGGYDYSSLIEIWRAANQTKSNVLFWWWRPEALIEEYHGTDAQFQQVLLPEATDICSRSRVSTENRCSLDIMERRGDPEGACDQEAHALQKVYSKAFVEFSNALTGAAKSPGFDLIKAVKITDLEINNMLRRWIHINNDRYGNDAREAVCGWVVDNIDSLMDFIPSGFPKQLSEKSSYDTVFLHSATALAVGAMSVVLVTAAMAFRWRFTKVFIYAQSHIVSLILCGFLLITISSILETLRPSDAICVAQTWLVNLGYTIELVPLLVKIAAINKILSSAKKMKRVRISRQGMLLNVGFVVSFIVAYLTVWTILDPPQKVERRILPDEQSTIIETSLTCTSNRDFWVVLALGWQGLLLLMASALAFQSRDIVQEFNESRSLGTMIYSHLLFLVLRGIVYNLGNTKDDAEDAVFRPNVTAAITSCLLSLDTLFAIIIYLIPKCVEAKVSPDGYNPNNDVTSSHSHYSGGNNIQNNNNSNHHHHNNNNHHKRVNSMYARSSFAVSEIEARAMAATMSYNSSMQQQQYQRDGIMSMSSSIIYNNNNSIFEASGRSGGGRRDSLTRGGSNNNGTGTSGNGTNHFGSASFRQSFINTNTNSSGDGSGHDDSFNNHHDGDNSSNNIIIPSIPPPRRRSNCFEIREVSCESESEEILLQQLSSSQRQLQASSSQEMVLPPIVESTTAASASVSSAGGDPNVIKANTNTNATKTTIMDTLIDNNSDDDKDDDSDGSIDINNNDNNNKNNKKESHKNSNNNNNNKKIHEQLSNSFRTDATGAIIQSPITTPTKPTTTKTTTTTTKTTTTKGDTNRMNRQGSSSFLRLRKSLSTKKSNNNNNSNDTGGNNNSSNNENNTDTTVAQDKKKKSIKNKKNNNNNNNRDTKNDNFVRSSGSFRLVDLVQQASERQIKSARDSFIKSASSSFSTAASASASVSSPLSLLHKMASTKASSLRLGHLEQQQQQQQNLRSRNHNHDRRSSSEYDDDDDDEDDYDVGGPRFANRRVNEAMNLSVRMKSSQSMNFNLTDEEEEDNNYNGDDDNDDDDGNNDDNIDDSIIVENDDDHDDNNDNYDDNDQDNDNDDKNDHGDGNDHDESKETDNYNNNNSTNLGQSTEKKDKAKEMSDTNSSSAVPVTATTTTSTTAIVENVLDITNDNDSSNNTSNSGSSSLPIRMDPALPPPSSPQQPQQQQQQGNDHDDHDETSTDNLDKQKQQVDHFSNPSSPKPEMRPNENGNNNDNIEEEENLELGTTKITNDEETMNENSTQATSTTTLKEEEEEYDNISDKTEKYQEENQKNDDTNYKEGNAKNDDIV